MPASPRSNVFPVSRNLPQREAFGRQHDRTLLATERKALPRREAGPTPSPTLRAMRHPGRPCRAPGRARPQRLAARRHRSQRRRERTCSSVPPWSSGLSTRISQPCHRRLDRRAPERGGRRQAADSPLPGRNGPAFPRSPRWTACRPSSVSGCRAAPLKAQQVRTRCGSVSSSQRQVASGRHRRPWCRSSERASAAIGRNSRRESQGAHTGRPQGISRQGLQAPKTSDSLTARANPFGKSHKIPEIPTRGPHANNRMARPCRRDGRCATASISSAAKVK